MNSDAFVFGVDLDGVCADFYAGLRPIAAEWLGVPEESLTKEVSYSFAEWPLETMGTYSDLHRFAVTQRELFKKLIPMEGAPAALRRLSLEGVRIRIITHRLFISSFHRVAISQTTDWLDYHGIPYWDLCFMRDKAAVGADLYIEDAPANIEALRNDGHPTLVFTNSTNRHVAAPRASNWAEVEEFVRQELGKWRTLRGVRPKHLAGE